MQTYNERNSKPRQKHRLGKVSKNTNEVRGGGGGLKSILRGHSPRPDFCRGIYKTFVQSA